MIIVGELLNASRKRIARAIREADGAAIQQVAADEHAAGAAFVDVNAGVFEDREADLLPWMVRTVQDAVDTPCSIDSPNPRAMEAAIEVHRGAPLLNSISLEKERFDAVLPLVAGTDFRVVALCMSDDGMPEETGQRVANADRLINELVRRDVPLEHIFVDPLVQPVSTGDRYVQQFLGAVEAIMTRFPGVHTICGLSNVSFGLPRRKILNRAFAVMAVSRGLDAAILNPLDRKLMTAVITAETLAGRDEYCGRYIDAHRAERLEA